MEAIIDSMHNLSCILQYSRKAFYFPYQLAVDHSSARPETSVVRPYLIWTGGGYSQRGANSWRGDTSGLVLGVSCPPRSPCLSCCFTAYMAGLSSPPEVSGIQFNHSILYTIFSIWGRGLKKKKVVPQFHDIQDCFQSMFCL